MTSKSEQNFVSNSDNISGGSIFIGGVENFSLVDFPGKIAAVLFLKGCPWRCHFCYNTHLQKMDGRSDFDWENVKNFLKKRKGMLDAVVFSGGEPLMQKGINRAVKEVKDMGYIAAIHTCGCYPEKLKEVLPDIGWVGLDIKAPFKKEHYKKAVGGVDSLEEVSQSLDIIIKSGIEFETRTTCDPRILSVEDIYEIAEFLKSKGVKNYNLQRYRQVPRDNTPDMECDKFFNDVKLEKFLKDNFDNVELRK
ncbi:MAG: anaerobic ribonucleoside-triphosphate reductase activating protein [Lactobacillaceae bacterium]|jgi:pyruvate formate lyase activating enzyme|nr:anaerobic ribonucleoside-triphosphate reductase activating protein [Lactobacillaceae bacterium]